jgi:hypothetical protein
MLQYTDPSTNMYFQRLRLDYSAIHVGPANMETVMEGAIDKVSSSCYKQVNMFKLRMCAMSCDAMSNVMLFCFARSCFEHCEAVSALVNTLLQHRTCTHVVKLMVTHS